MTNEEEKELAEMKPILQKLVNKVVTGKTKKKREEEAAILGGSIAFFMPMIVDGAIEVAEENPMTRLMIKVKASTGDCMLTKAIQGKKGKV